jgi:hypothetical protein
LFLCTAATELCIQRSFLTILEMDVNEFILKEDSCHDNGSVHEYNSSPWKSIFIQTNYIRNAKGTAFSLLETLFLHYSSNGLTLVSTINIYFRSRDTRSRLPSWQCSAGRPCPVFSCKLSDFASTPRINP